MTCREIRYVIFCGGDIWATSRPYGNNTILLSAQFMEERQKKLKNVKWKKMEGIRRKIRIETSTLANTVYPGHRKHLLRHSMADLAANNSTITIIIIIQFSLLPTCTLHLSIYPSQLLPFIVIHFLVVCAACKQLGWALRGLTIK